MEMLIRALCRRGIRMATIKRHSHSGFETDQTSRDSWRHARAGSRHVVAAAPDKIASYRLLYHELSLDEIACEIRGVELILGRATGMPTCPPSRLSGQTMDWAALPA
ncbi:MAG: molybdopterin-guanine dinucleotide biosynthesis protein MobB [Chloroflexi bacterium]|nr:molybdopterin-guanine dinucleotide biosynthesis protein MobB [Chloroflexota bacterium]